MDKLEKASHKFFFTLAILGAFLLLRTHQGPFHHLAFNVASFLCNYTALDDKNRLLSILYFIFTRY